ncbi:FMN-dependent oxidoreductase (nitrilotriacetate monooxygenase family) [Salana multivorans]|uniref:FMN-dependent oxidoreductase (Nitrilotriacetate monooxygenase family) n=1 Tax=Salana multivorans TaxID=120377 RepID=A0A3N2DA87_9MICO|nr:NtaA/DmoA family FMN-dependent monooxygenase [Salana multivorans]ROR96538.1 FMN-dependent oxidoreductase (nitrilotriacetate monooxygenase family) [Salana multivorans]
MSASARPPDRDHPITRPTATVHLGVFFQGVNHHTVWSDPRSGSQTDFSSFRRLAETAERGLFDAFFLGEGLRLRETNGALHDLDVVGRPDAITQLSALAAVTSRIGLVATQNTTYNDPADLARRLASLDVLSGGRAAWNVVTTDNAWTGANFRRGGYLDHADRYVRAAEFVRAARAIWDSFADDAIATTTREPSWSRPGAITPVAFSGATVSTHVTPTVPRSPQGHPVIFQAGDSPAGRTFAAEHADVIFSSHGSDLDDALAFARDVRRRVAAAGRPRDDVKILPGTSFVLGDTEAEARELATWLVREQISGATALSILSHIWGEDLSQLDPDGPLPDHDPAPRELSRTRGTGAAQGDPAGLARRLRSHAEELGLSIREAVIATDRRPAFVGTPSSVADRLVRFVRTGAVDGFNVSPWLVPDGLDEVVDRLVPELQERAAYPTEYVGTTLREHLGLRSSRDVHGARDAIQRTVVGA